MRKPKEPKSFKRPRLYFQPGGFDSISNGRFRIIYPDGRAEYWVETQEPMSYIPCWQEPWCNSGPKAITLMRNFDRNFHWPEADFLGEL